jgi:hypothetical protein
VKETCKQCAPGYFSNASLVSVCKAKSKYVDESVFKGGTSLSKGYNLIERFSEDIDIAIINDKEKTGNEIKNLIRTIEKEITPDLTELKTFEMKFVDSEGTPVNFPKNSYFTFTLRIIENTPLMDMES